MYCMVLLLGRVALVAHVRIRAYVRRSVCPVHCGKTADRTGPWIRQIVGFGEWSTGRGIFGGEFGAHHCNQ